MWCDLFNVGWATQWDVADGLWVNPNVEPETTGLAILILRQMARPSHCQATSWGYYWQRAWKTLHPRWILHAPSAISIHDGVSPSEPRTWTLLSGAGCSVDFASATPNNIWSMTVCSFMKIKKINIEYDSNLKTTLMPLIVIIIV